MIKEKYLSLYCMMKHYMKLASALHFQAQVFQMLLHNWQLVCILLCKNTVCIQVMIYIFEAALIEQIYRLVGYLPSKQRWASELRITRMQDSPELEGSSTQSQRYKIRSRVWHPTYYANVVIVYKPQYYQQLLFNNGLVTHKHMRATCMLSYYVHQEHGEIPGMKQCTEYSYNAIIVVC